LAHQPLNHTEAYTSEKAEQNRYQRHLALRIRPPLYVHYLTVHPQIPEPITFLRQRLMAEYRPTKALSQNVHRLRKTDIFIGWPILLKAA
jgi:hypothetical protein